MEGVGNVEWHGQDYLLLKWHVLCSGLATAGLAHGISRTGRRFLHTHNPGRARAAQLVVESMHRESCHCMA